MYRHATTCLVTPLPEYDAAASLMSEAADAILAKDLGLARELVRQADMPVLYEHAAAVMGGRHPGTQFRQPITGPIAKAGKAAPRMPTDTVRRFLHARDGWRCRFCDCRVVSPKARSAMRAALPGAIPWSDTEGHHGAFYALSASLDHVVPYSAGGTNGEENLVTACWPCQFGKGSFRLEELGLLDPRVRPPIDDGWDGLVRLLDKPELRTVGYNAGDMSPAPARQSKRSAAEWFSSLDDIRPMTSSRLINVIEDCADLDVSWSLEKVLLVRMRSGGQALNLIGVQPDGTCVIPWSIGDAKDVFRIFAETLAGGLPDAVFYETARMWVVAKSGKKRIDVLELLDAGPVLRQALHALRSRLLKDRT